MNTVLIVCSIVLTSACVVTVVYLVQLLIQVRKATCEIKNILKNINEEIIVIRRITDTVSSFSEKVGSPVFKTSTWLASFISVLLKKRKEGTANDRD